MTLHTQQSAVSAEFQPRLAQPCVAVIGAGFSGTAVAIHLARRLPVGARLILLEQSELFGRGVAYACDCASHWLNVPAGRLGFDPEHEGEFLAWLQTRRPSYRGGDFVPRALLGDYLSDTLTQALDAAHLRGVQVQRLRASVLDVQRDGAQWHVLLAGAQTLVADQVVLALGFGATQTPPLPGGQSWAQAGLIANPLANDALDGIGETDDVLVLGSGLTAVDAITALQDRGHQGRLLTLSRRGLWPRAHRPLEARPAAGISALDRLGSERRLRPLLHAVRAWVREASAQGQDWRDVMASLRPATPTLWQRLSLRDRRQFLRHLSAWWDVHRHRMAPGIHSRLMAERERGRLHCAAGRLTQLSAVGAGWQVQWVPRGGGLPQTRTVQAIINCTGASTRLHPGHSALVAQLHARGQLSGDACGLGILVDEHLQPMNIDGQAQTGLYYLGPMLKAQYWEAIAIPELRLHARNLAQTVLTSGWLDRFYPAPTSSCRSVADKSC